jgi:hypothetical protein
MDVSLCDDDDEVRQAAHDWSSGTLQGVPVVIDFDSIESDVFVSSSGHLGVFVYAKVTMGALKPAAQGKARREASMQGVPSLDTLSRASIPPQKVQLERG